ncbi:hypothetical protein RCL1_006390 [Eukaryota sp. TZLM3-RCL]
MTNIDVSIRLKPSDGQFPTYRFRINNNFLHKESTCYGPFRFIFDQSCLNQNINSIIVNSIVDKVVKGYNGTIMAYGMTSSGKTHTMIGTSDDPGLILHSLHRIFDKINQTGDSQSTISASFVEIFNDSFYDLLDTTKSPSLSTSSSGSVSLKDCTDEVVSSPSQAYHLLEKGLMRRKVAETRMNTRSSRSHAVFRITLKSGPTTSHLYLVDLAGSERVSMSGASGAQLKEAGDINKSLSALSNVINQIVDKSKHVSFRSTKLTHLLSSALGGNSFTSIICCVTTLKSHEHQTLSTLNFAMKSKDVKNRPHVNTIVDVNTRNKELEQKVYTLTAEKATLVAKLEALKLGPSTVNHRTFDRRKTLASSTVGNLGQNIENFKALSRDDSFLSFSQQSSLHPLESSTFPLHSHLRDTCDHHDELLVEDSVVEDIETPTVSECDNEGSESTDYAVEHLTAVITDLTAQIEHLSSELTNKDSIISFLEEKIRTNTESYEFEKVELLRLNAEKEDVITLLSRSIEQSETSFAKEKSLFEEKIQEQTEYINVLLAHSHSTEAILSNQIDQISTEKSGLESSLSDLTHSNNVLVSHTAQLEQQLRTERSAHEAKLAEKEEIIKSSTLRIGLLSSENSRLQEIIEKKQADNYSLTCTIEELEANVNQFSTALNEKEAVVMNLTDRLETLETEYLLKTELEESLSNKDSTIETLNCVISQLNSDLNQSKSIIAEKHSLIQSLMAKISKTDQLENSRALAADLTDKVAHLTEESSHLQLLENAQTCVKSLASTVSLLTPKPIRSTKSRRKPCRVPSDVRTPLTLPTTTTSVRSKRPSFSLVANQVDLFSTTVTDIGLPLPNLMSPLGKKTVENCSLHDSGDESFDGSLEVQKSVPVVSTKEASITSHTVLSDPVDVNESQCFTPVIPSRRPPFASLQDTWDSPMKEVYIKSCKVRREQELRLTSSTTRETLSRKLKEMREMSFVN